MYVSKLGLRIPLTNHGYIITEDITRLNYKLNSEVICLNCLINPIIFSSTGINGHFA